MSNNFFKFRPFFSPVPLPVQVFPLQVNAQDGREGWEAALDMDAPWLTCLWPEVNHLLMRPEADASIAGTADEYNLACTVDAAVTQAMADFILNNGGQAQ